MNLLKDVSGVLKHEKMFKIIVKCLGKFGGDPEVELHGLVQRVLGRFEASRKFPTLLQFIQDHSKLRDQELVALFSFIYYSLVNCFKGELAELMARPSFAKFSKILQRKLGPTPIDVVEGHELAAPTRLRNSGFYKWADVCFVRAEACGVEIVGIGEIKSMLRPVEEMHEQIRRHVIRLKRGVRIRGAFLEPHVVSVRTADGRRVPAADLDGDAAALVPALLVRPWTDAKSATPVSIPNLPNAWISELPYGEDFLMEAAYRFAAWYFGTMGPKAFYKDGDESVVVGDRRRRAPHSEMSLEENGSNSLMEALYAAGLREVFVFPGDAPKTGGRQTPGEVLVRLCNTFGFGFEKHPTTVPYFPPVDENPTRERREERWNAAMALYRAGNLEVALETFPDPAGATDPHWRHREWLMRARLCARVGDVTGARQALDARVALRPVVSMTMPLEILGVEALTDWAEHQIDGAKARFLQAMAKRDELRGVVSEHEERGWAFPADFQATCAQFATIDLAVCAVLFGDEPAALALLFGLRRSPGWDAEQVTNDRTLRKLFDAPGVLDRFEASIGRKGGLQMF